MSDPKAFYDKHKTLVYHLALNYCGNKEDAEEITQDVFITVFKKMSSFRYESKIETCVYRVTINKSLDRTIVDIVDISAKKTREKYNTPLFYMYKNGNVDRKLSIQ